MKKFLILSILISLPLSLLAYASLAPSAPPLFEIESIEDHGDNFTVNYLVNRVGDGYVHELLTDLHIEAPEWNPGAVTVTGPPGYEGHYDGAFIHWSMESNGSPIIQGNIQNGFSINFQIEFEHIEMLNKPINYTNNPADPLSIFATGLAMIPVPKL